MPPVVIGAAIVGAGAVASSAISSNAAKKAASTSADAAASSNATTLAMYNTTRDDLSTYRDVGTQAADEISANKDYWNDDYTFNDFLNSDEYKGLYQYGMDQGTTALNRSDAASGGVLGGATLKALTRFGTDYTNQTYQDVWNRYNTDRNNRYNRLYNLLGIGENAAAHTGNAGSLAANQISSNNNSAANTSAAATIASANMTNKAIGTVTNTWSEYAMTPKTTIP